MENPDCLVNSALKFLAAARPAAIVAGKSVSVIYRNAFKSCAAGSIDPGTQPTWWLSSLAKSCRNDRTRTHSKTALNPTTVCRYTIHP